MSLISTSTKAKLGLRASRAAAKRPQAILAGTKLALPAARMGLKATGPMAKMGLKAGKPLAKRRVRRRAEQLDRASRILGEALAVQAPRVAYDLGLAEPPKPTRIAPRVAPSVAAGVVIGAGAMYFLEPGHGAEHREKVAHLVT